MSSVVRLAVFSDREGYTMDGDPPASIPDGTLNSIYFSGMMTTINIILLNLLIAIMATSYSRVQKYSHLGEGPFFSSFFFFIGTFPSLSHIAQPRLISHLLSFFISPQRLCTSGPR